MLQDYPPHVIQSLKAEVRIPIKVIQNSAEISPILNTREIISSTETLLYISHIRFLETLHTFKAHEFRLCLPRWPRGLGCGSVAARLVALRVRILPGAWTRLLWVLCVVR
jgi:hypothetical protein